MAVRIDGKAVAAKVRGEIAEEVAALKKQGVQTGMAVVLVGEDPASKIYVRNKGKACAETGIYSEEHVLPENTTQEELLALIEKLNADPKINGILVQSPLPKHLNEALIVEHIDPKKDVDAFHAENVGRIMIGDFAFLPCTPAGIIELIRSTGVTIDGKNCVVIGRSNIVGKPMAMLLLHENGTVTICHSHTKNLKEICKTADILVVAVGKAKFVTGDMAYRSEKGRGRVPRRKCRPYHDRRFRVFAVYARGHHRTHPLYRRHNRRQKLRRHRPQQHRRQADGYAASA